MSAYRLGEREYLALPPSESGLGNGGLRLSGQVLADDPHAFLAFREKLVELPVDEATALRDALTRWLMDVEAHDE